jgi:uroporphyrinogen decarboxylase
MRRDEVLKAIDRRGPSYTPIYYVNGDQSRSDVVAIEVQHHFQGEKRDHSEWGFLWDRLDGTMGQPRSYLLRDELDLRGLAVPGICPARRFRDVPDFAKRFPDRFRMASLGLSGFTTMSCLRGFDRLMVDFGEDPAGVEKLADLVFDFEERLISELPSYRFDAVSFYDDWGTQQGMIISPRLWRSIFKPRYARQFALVRRLGMRVYFHCCGQFMPIIPDLIEAGVDILNVSQPNLYDIPELGRRFGGQVCFCCPVSYQTTSITGTREQIFEDVRLLVENLGRFNGGLLGYIEQYEEIGLTPSNYQSLIDAWGRT